MTSEPRIPRPTVDLEAVLVHLHAVQRQATPTTIATAVADIPVLLAEIARIAHLLSRSRWDFANLLAASRATLAAEQDGESDPLTYLRDAVADHRALPPPDHDDSAQ